MKAFTKNQKVTYFNNWDRKGTYTYRHAIVYSCGKVQMVLTDAETGEEMGRHFRPERGIGIDQFGNTSHDATFERMSDDDAKAKCIEMAEQYLVLERERIESRIENNRNSEYSDKGYRDAMREKLDELHEPRGMSYRDARQEMIANM